MAGLEFELDTSDYDIKMPMLQRGIKNFTPRIVRESAEIVEENLRYVIPVDKGNLLDSIDKSVADTWAVIYTASGYGKFVNEDTRPHVIRARVAQFLRFEIDGVVFFRKEVNHPGTKGQHFTRQAIEISEPEIIDRVKQIWDEETGME